MSKEIISDVKMAISKASALAMEATSGDGISTFLYSISTALKALGDYEKITSDLKRNQKE